MGRGGLREYPENPPGKRRASGARGRGLLRVPGQHRPPRAGTAGRRLCPARACTSPKSSPTAPPATGASESRVLGTKYTMQGPIYPRELAGRGIAAEVPGAYDRLLINKIIFDELVAGVFSASSRGELDSRHRGDGGVGAATRPRSSARKSRCSSRRTTSPLPTLDSTRLLAQAAFEVSVGRRPMPTWRGGERK